MPRIREEPGRIFSRKRNASIILIKSLVGVSEYFSVEYSCFCRNMLINAIREKNIWQNLPEVSAAFIHVCTSVSSDV